MMSITSDRLREHFNHDVTESAANEIEALEKSECEAWKTVAKLRFALAETEALEISHGERIEKLTAERDELLEANRIACEDIVERHDRIVELKQQRDEIERDRNYLLLNAEVAMKCIGDMGPSKRAVKAYSILQEAIASVKEK